MKKLLILPLAALSISATFYLAGDPSSAPKNWFNLAYSETGTHGVGTERAYKELLTGKKADTIIVAVIDGGVDYNHEDLKNVMWHNPGEIPGNKIDDDKNGYVDDIYGWNFIGGANGENVNYDNLEMVRLLRNYKKKFKGMDSASVPAADREAYKEYRSIQKDYDMEVAQFTGYKQNLSAFNMYFKDIAKSYNKDSATYEDFKNWVPGPRYEKMHKRIKLITRTEESYRELRAGVNEGIQQIDARLDYHLNLDFDPRNIVGDNYNDATERFYGNADIKGPNSFHGTHVAGIIAAQRGNGLGMDGVSNAVKIMGIRVVPDGDERDKDVANGIRYAVDNGAKVINMSFGKSYVFNKAVVDEAVKYAESKGVLLVHAAGNDSKDNDATKNFPNPRYENGGTAGNWIEVGALNWKTGKHSCAPFTNYGQKNVDVFAPGVDIYSCAPESKYQNASGTSMACPVTAGVATVILNYYPSMTPAQVKAAIENSSDRSIAKKKVIIPGEKKKKAKFSVFSRTGGMVDLYAAIKMLQNPAPAAGK
jgi:cell wall-associated protease